MLKKTKVARRLSETITNGPRKTFKKDPDVSHFQGSRIGVLLEQNQLNGKWIIGASVAWVKRKLEKLEKFYWEKRLKADKEDKLKNNNENWAWTDHHW